MADVQRIHIDLPPGSAPGHPDYFAVQPGDVVDVVEDADGGGWKWVLKRPDGRAKLEQGNFPSQDEAREAAPEVEA